MRFLILVSGLILAAPLATALPTAAGPAPIVLTATQQGNLGIRTVTLAAAAEHPLIVLPAMVAPPPNAAVAIAAPFAGTVTHLAVVEGQAVTAGQPLATLFSHDMLASQSALRQAEAEERAAEAEAARVRQLVEDGIAAGARLDEAEARAARARAAAAEQRHMISKARPVRTEPGSYELSATIAGRVARIDVTVGGAVTAMGTAFLIDRTDRLWLEAKLPAALASSVKPGMTVEVAGQRGRVVAVGSRLDPATRSLVLRADIPGHPALLAGQAASMTILAPAAPGSFTVPQAAVTRIAGRDSVFVARKDGFAAVPVRISGRGAQTLTVTGALKPGDRVVTAGVSELKVLATQD